MQSKHVTQKIRLIIALCPAVVLVTFGLIIAHNLDQRARIGLLSERAQLVAQNIDQRLETALEIVEFCANSPHLVEHLNLSTLLDECSRLADRVGMWVVIIEIGKVHTHILNTRLDQGDEYPSYPRLEEAATLINLEDQTRKTGRPSVADVFQGQVVRDGVVSAGQFQRTANDLDVMVYAGFNASDILEIFEKYKFEDLETFFVLDSQGHVVSKSSNYNEKIFQRGPNWARSVSQVDKPRVVQHSKINDDENQKSFSVVHPLNVAEGWMVFVTIPNRLFSANGNLAALPLIMALGGVFTSVISLYFIGRRERSRQELLEFKRAKALAEQQNEEKSRLLATIAHDIRNPLISLLGSLEVEDESPQLSQASKIRASRTAQGLLQMVDDILELSYLSSGEFRLTPSLTDLTGFTMDLAFEFQKLAETKGLHLAYDVDPRLPRTLLIDRLRLRQIVSNLLVNAIKFTEAGSIILKLRLVDIVKRRPLIEISVKDTGIGISQDKIPEIFKEFGKLERRTTTNDTKCTGLGLAICQRLLRAMNSELLVDSTPGKGTRFYFFLDLHTYIEEGIPASLLLQQLALKDVRILYAEDEPVIRTLTVRNLEAAGAIVSEAADGKELLKKLANVQPDMILLDLEMPELDGIETVRKLRGNDIDFSGPIFILTSHISGPKTAKALEAGATDVITKPIQVIALAAAYAARRGSYGRNATGLSSAGVNSHATEPLLDHVMLQSLMNVNVEEFQDSYLPRFKMGLAKALHQIRKPVIDDDYTGALDVLHSQKGLAMTFGAKRLTALITSLENSITINDRERISALSLELEQVSAQTFEAMQAAIDLN